MGDNGEDLGAVVGREVDMGHAGPVEEARAGSGNDQDDC